MKKIIICILFVLIAVLITCSFFVEEEARIAANGEEIVQFVVDPQKPMVAITYDDGPHQTVTNDILDTLERYEAHATFFMIGDRISHHADLIKRMVSLGCELGNHTYGHLDLSRMNENDINNQLRSSEDALASVVDYDYLPKLVRPPFGNTNENLLKTCPYPLIVWSIDTRDWSHQNVSRTVNEVMNNVQDGDIILMHDMYDATAKATEEIVRRLTEEGYQLLTVSEMFEAKGIVLEAGKLYHHAH